MANVLLRTAVCLLIISVGRLAAVKCWQFTWPGNIDWDSPIANETTCEGRSEPCIEPFVLSMNATPPNLTELDILCQGGGCPPEIWCNTKGAESCVKYVYWTTDPATNEPKMANYSLFCGSARSGNADTGVYSDVVTSGCYEQDINSYTLKTCFCHNSDQCNAASASSLRLSSWLAAAILVWSLVTVTGGTWRT